MANRQANAVISGGLVSDVITLRKKQFEGGETKAMPENRWQGIESV